MLKQDLRVGLAGATGALGTEIIRSLERSKLPIGELRPMASPRCAVPSVEFRGKKLLVRDFHPKEFPECDLIVLALPRQIALEHAESILEKGSSIIDMSGACESELGASTVVAEVNPELLESFRSSRMVGSPLPLTVILSTLLAPLSARIAGIRVRGALLRSASIRGRDGSEEFSRQVVSLFNSKKAPQKIFPQGLAFDVEAACEEPGISGWSESELLVSSQTEHVLGLGLGNIALTNMIIPIFTGLGLSLQIRGDEPIDSVAFRRLLSESRSIHLVEGHAQREQPRPRRFDRIRGIQVGRLRDDPQGDGVHLWAVSDETVFGAAENAVGILGEILRRDLIG